MKYQVTQEQIRHLFSYNSCDLVWENKPNSKSNNIKIGKIAGYINKKGYRQIMLGGGYFYPSHRLIWLYIYGELPKGEIDHINGITYDNRIENLQDMPHRLNCKNKKRPVNNKSGCTGVSWNKKLNKWTAQGKSEGKQEHLGCFAEWWDAVCVRKSWEVRTGFHKNHGRVDCE